MKMIIINLSLLTNKFKNQIVILCTVTYPLAIKGAV